MKLLDRNSVLIDPFCGIGPFALPAVKKNCKVYANDLNPESIRWLRESLKLNKIPESNLNVYNLDAKDFFDQVIPEIFDCAEPEAGQGSKASETNYHIPMNLPSLAHTFLEPLKDALLRTKLVLTADVFIHLYCFVTKQDPKDEAILLTFESLNLKAKLNFEEFGAECEVQDVRDVSTNKVMMCVSFELNKLVNNEKEWERNCVASSDSKRLKLE